MILFRPLIRYADFKGRARRSEIWLFGLLQGVLYACLIGLALTSLAQLEEGGDGWGVLIAVGLMGLCVVGFFVPNYAVLVRRLHDTGRGAIWLCLMLPSVISGILTFLTLFTAMNAVGLGAGRDAFVGTALTGFGAAGAMAVIGMVCQGIMLVLTLTPGTRGENRFGPDPRDPSRLYSGGGGATYDEARLDALFAEAKRAHAEAEHPHTPVFDFGPGPARPEPTPRAPVAWNTPAPHAAAPARPFGRRGA